jgi:hypothetical protein
MMPIRPDPDPNNKVYSRDREGKFTGISVLIMRPSLLKVVQFTIVFHDILSSCGNYFSCTNSQLPVLT